MREEIKSQDREIYSPCMINGKLNSFNLFCQTENTLRVSNLFPEKQSQTPADDIILI